MSSLAFVKFDVSSVGQFMTAGMLKNQLFGPGKCRPIIVYISYVDGCGGEMH